MSIATALISSVIAAIVSAVVMKIKMTKQAIDDAKSEREKDNAELKELILRKIPEMQVRIDNVGPVIGAHCGPGTLAICFLGKERQV
jgi:fatty acid-binding protein DegV